MPQTQAIVRERTTIEFVNDELPLETLADARLAADQLYARALQHKLIENFSADLNVDQLSFSNRAMVIVGLSAALWAIIGLIILAVA